MNLFWTLVIIGIIGFFVFSKLPTAIQEGIKEKVSSSIESIINKTIENETFDEVIIENKTSENKTVDNYMFTNLGKPMISTPCISDEMCNQYIQECENKCTCELEIGDCIN